MFTLLNYCTSFPFKSLSLGPKLKQTSSQHRDKGGGVESRPERVFFDAETFFEKLNSLTLICLLNSCRFTDQSMEFFFLQRIKFFGNFNYNYPCDKQGYCSRVLDFLPYIILGT